MQPTTEFHFPGLQTTVYRAAQSDVASRTMELKTAEEAHRAAIRAEVGLRGREAFRAAVKVNAAYKAVEAARVMLAKAQLVRENLWHTATRTV